MITEEQINVIYQQVIQRGFHTPKLTTEFIMHTNLILLEAYPKTDPQDLLFITALIVGREQESKVIEVYRYLGMLHTCATAKKYIKVEGQAIVPNGEMLHVFQTLENVPKVFENRPLLRLDFEFWFCVGLASLITFGVFLFEIIWAVIK